ncbi:MAG: hypothetical protein J0L64_14075 [Acidobacteria bacterium]|nr:hypothetical protein [Acidobacteriota bacterium]
MHRRVWLSLIVGGAASLPAMARDRGGRAQFIGGTVEDLPVGVNGALFTTHRLMFHFATKKTTLAVPYERINLLEYGQKVDRRYVAAVLLSPLFLLSKSRRHFLTLGYVDERGDQQALVFQVEKGDVRVVLSSLEARTG